MKLFLEEETLEEGEKVIKKVKVVKDMAEALTMKDTKKKQFIHKCHHDEKDSRGCCKPCSREKI